MTEAQKDNKILKEVNMKCTKEIEVTDSLVKFKEGTKDNTVYSLRKHTRNITDNEKTEKVERTGGVKLQFLIKK